MFYFSVEQKSTGPNDDCKKRMCNRMVYLTLLGPTHDSLFFKSKSEIECVVSTFNQSTRVWLGVKFLRRLPIDFSENAKLNFRYSHREICSLLGISRTTIHRITTDPRHKNVPVKDIASRYNYLSPLEYCAKGQENYFRRIASNYYDLVGSKFFVCNKEDTSLCPHKKKLSVYT